MSTTALPAPDPIRLAPVALWRVAETFLRFMFVLFGAPEDVAASHTLSRKLALQLRAWLAAGEALLRRLLLIEAAAWAKRLPAPHASTRTHTRAPRERRLMSFTADKPDAWRVRFRCFPKLTCASAAATRQRKPRRRPRPIKRFHDAWPLAERFEALRRVFNDPTAFARRLARRLRARPHLRRAALYEPPGAAALVGASDFHAATDAAETAWCNSS